MTQPVQDKAEGWTKGPWHAGHLGSEGRCQCKTIVSEYYAGGIATVCVHNGIEGIAEGSNDAPPEAEAVSNMHLIAAAPELYEALKAAQEELRLIRMKDTDAVYDPSLRTRITMALSLAKGDSQP